MEFKEFKKNVEEWARVRGIYDQSTEAHQQAKALEEIGEYLTATNDDERMDAIGDIAVCIVNASKFAPLNIDNFKNHKFSMKKDYLAGASYNIVTGRYNHALKYLYEACILSELYNKDFKFDSCLSKAWKEIKDRKGMMIDGKYVKWDSMTEEQKAEFNRRDSGNTLIRE